mgnify:CR=1 FL=1
MIKNYLKKHKKSGFPLFEYFIRLEEVSESTHKHK